MEVEKIGRWESQYYIWQAKKGHEDVVALLEKRARDRDHTKCK